MAFNSTTNRVSFAGNGSTTVFSFPYYFQSQSDLKVILRDADGVETTKTLTTHYTVSGTLTNNVYASGGSVTMLTAPASGETLIIYRDPAITQGVDLVANDSLPAETLEQALDKAAMIAQRLDDRLDRTVGKSDGYTATFDPTLPADLHEYPGAVLYVNADGDGFGAMEDSPTIDEIADAAASAAAAATDAASAAASASNASDSADAAATSASSASTSATAASGSASSASTSASNASTSESNALSYRNAAQTAKTAAEAAQGVAEAKALEASGSATSADTSAVAASASASSASTSASNAAGSATAAATSAAAAAASAASLTQLWAGTSGGAANVQTLTPSPALSSYTTGIGLGFVAGFTNTGATTVNVSGLGAKSLKTQRGDDLPASGIVSGRVYNIIYDGTNFIVRELLPTALRSQTGVKTGAYSIALTDDTIRCDVSAGAFTVTLPTAVGIQGKKFKIVQTGTFSYTASQRALTVATTSSQTIGGQTTRKLYSQNEMIEVESDGANWIITNRYIPAGPWVNSGAITVTGSTTNPTKGTTSTDQLWLRRNGGNLECRVAYLQSTAGTAGSGDYLLGLPTACPVDTSLITADSTLEAGGGDYSIDNCVGHASINVASNGALGVVFVHDATRVRVVLLSSAASGGANSLGSWHSTYYNFTETALNIVANFSVPVSGWEG